MSSQTFLLLVLAPLALLITAYVIWPLLRPLSRTDADAGAAAAGTAVEVDADGTGGAQRLNREIVQERRAQLDRELSQLPPDSP
ncbi:MAG: hypothetical protein ACXWVT_11525, partial [Burkholderiaceae bacterium]